MKWLNYSLFSDAVFNITLPKWIAIINHIFKNEKQKKNILMKFSKCKYRCKSSYKVINSSLFHASKYFITFLGFFFADFKYKWKEQTHKMQSAWL